MALKKMTRETGVSLNIVIFKRDWGRFLSNCIGTNFFCYHKFADT